VCVTERRTAQRVNGSIVAIVVIVIFVIAVLVVVVEAAPRARVRPHTRSRGSRIFASQILIPELI